jgi:hypothetical protein
LSVDGDAPVNHRFTRAVYDAPRDRIVALSAITTNNAWALQLHGPAVLDVGRSTPTRLAIRRIAPNPAVGRWTLSVSLPGAEPGRLEMIDVMGRRCLALDLGRGPVAERAIAMERPPGLRSGIYWLRLMQGGRSVNSRIVFLD